MLNALHYYSKSFATYAVSTTKRTFALPKTSILTVRKEKINYDKELKGAKLSL